MIDKEKQLVLVGVCLTERGHNSTIAVYGFCPYFTANETQIRTTLGNSQNVLCTHVDDIVYTYMQHRNAVNACSYRKQPMRLKYFT